MKNARAGREKLLFLPTKYANLWRSRCRRRCRCFSSLMIQEAEDARVCTTPTVVSSAVYYENVGTLFMLYWISKAILGLHFCATIQPITGNWLTISRAYRRLQGICNVFRLALSIVGVSCDWTHKYLNCIIQDEITYVSFCPLVAVFHPISFEQWRRLEGPRTPWPRLMQCVLFCFQAGLLHWKQGKGEVKSLLRTRKPIRPAIISGFL